MPREPGRNGAMLLAGPDRVGVPDGVRVAEGRWDVRDWGPLVEIPVVATHNCLLLSILGNDDTSGNERGDTGVGRPYAQQERRSCRRVLATRASESRRSAASGWYKIELDLDATRARGTEHGKDISFAGTEQRRAHRR